MREAHDLFDRGDFGAARSAYAELSRGRPTPEAHVNIGYCDLMMGERARAEQSFRAALELRSDFAPAWVGLGDACAARADHEQAVACYGRALDASPGHAVALNNRSLSLTALGRLAEAWHDAEA